MKSILSIVLLVVASIIISNSAYTVKQTEQVFITQFGMFVGDAINADPEKNEAGLHWKTPFIQKVNSIEKRILEWDGPATDMPTRDKLYINVDTFARWRISDPKTYYEKLRDERSALSRLDDIIGSATRDSIAANDLIEVVRSEKDRKPAVDESLIAANSNIGILPAIKHGRKVLTEQILSAAQPKVQAWGIELIDVRFKRINYKSDVIGEIYSRMASERLQIADRFRSEGAGEAAIIIGRKDRDLLQIKSEAYRKEREIQGKADAEATSIYADAYSSSPVAADFYLFIKTLETYQRTLGKDTTAIFTTDSDLFSLFKSIDGKKKGEQ
ncbi:protease modulator HflC [Rubritalea profundi]|uniref:Protein HflC n=1 Tax=Rubritalea profundi TaxID=1658618 RepID=A0A2S7U096_9BACT|nr:protease modulator HflC [Rubritalea profundi]PQJ28426.1 HflC protein [Rubritalea profundi]